MVRIDLNFDADERPLRRRLYAYHHVFKYLEQPATGILLQGGTPADYARKLVDEAVAAVFDDGFSHDRRDLSELIDEVCSKVTARQEQNRKNDAGAADVLQPLLDGFMAVSEKYRHCKSCTLSRSCTGKHKSCWHTARKDDKPDPPACLDSVFRRIDIAATLAEEMYRRHFPKLNEQVLARVTVRGNANSAVRQVNGITSHDFVNQIPEAKIGISVPTRTLDQSVFHSLVYVALHEMAVHAVQEVFGRAAPKPPKRFIAFADGLVDEAVYQELDASKWARDNSSALRAAQARRDTMRLGEDRALPGEIDAGRAGLDVLKRLEDRHRRNLSCKQKGVWARRVVFALNLQPFDEQFRNDLLVLIVDWEARLFAHVGLDAAKSQRCEGRFVSYLDGIAKSPSSRICHNKLRQFVTDMKLVPRAKA
ncbi:MAG: hypothetical protein EP335_03755 [Alphaproteobacteria bacterium]|nr:MAG: hypothetical protein EP335_03755 [Alphaproteobacteria bacterium]